MSITNNFIKINDIAVRPAPKFNIAYETFKSGEYIIGGLLKITLTGEIYGISSSDLTDKIKTLSNYSGTCQSIYIECDNSTLIDGQGFIRNVSFNPTDQPFMVNYSVDIEISNTSSNLSITPDAAFASLYGLSIPNTIVLKSYEESLAFNSDDSIANTAFYVDGTYTKASVKLSGQISIQAHHHMCDTFESPDLIAQLHTILNGRVQQLLSLNAALSTTYPSLANYLQGNHYAIHHNKTLTINKFDHKIDFKFDMFIISGTCHPRGMVDLDITETTDQFTGLSSWSIKGSVQGLSDGTSSTTDNDTLYNTRLINARLIYADLEHKKALSEYEHFIVLGCSTAASLPSDSCYQRISAQITENFNGGRIDFEMSFGDIESCQVGGASIDINIQEEHPTNKYIEHIIPGRGSALVQIGDNISPRKITITASSKLNTCDTELISTLISYVEDRFFTIITNKGYDNYLLVKESKTTGKYSYKISRSYIECV